MLIRSLFILLFVGFAVVGAAAGQVKLLLEIDGIPGSSTLKGHEGAIEISTFSFGASNSVSPTPGAGGGAGRAQFTEISFTKLVDTASPLLFQAVMTGKNIPRAVVRVLLTGADALTEFSTIQLEGVSVVEEELSGSSERPVESLSLKFSRIVWEVCSFDATGARAGCNTFSWDVAKNSP